MLARVGTRLPRPRAPGGWLRWLLAAAVLALTAGYLAWSARVLVPRFAGGPGAAGDGGRLLPRFLRAPTEAEEKEAVRAELGRGTWNTLHRLAAQFDKAPSAARQAEVAEFFRLLGAFYPCEQCAAHFRAMLSERPIRAANNRELSLWLCELHNEVNARLRKPLFPCTLEALKDKYGKCGCFDAPAPAANESAVAAASPAPPPRAPPIAPAARVRIRR
jgi:hypothetical protein